MNITIKDITGNITEYREMDRYSIKDNQVYIYYDNKEDNRHTIMIPFSSILSMDVV